jgi:hypothetical protein
MSETLLAQVRRKLNITWEDTDTDNRVYDIMKQARAKIIDVVGINDPEFDFVGDGTENTLYLAYCLYLFNHCENEFDNNYREDIMQARARHEVRQYAE